MIGSILGIILTLIFGFYSIRVYRKSKRKVSLEFKKKECYSLFRKDVNRLKIELTYNNNSLSNALILLKAKLINNGQVDIDKNRIYNPLKIKSTNIYKWLDVNVTYYPTGAQTNIEILNDQEIQLNWDLLKQNEYIEFEALVEIKSELEKEGEEGLDFYNSLSFDYRITDLDSIQKEKLISNSIKQKIYYEKANKILAIFVFIIGAFILSIEFFPSLNFLAENVVSYVIKNNNNELESIILAKNNSDKIFLLIDGEGKYREISVNDFNQSYQLLRIEKTAIDPKTKMYYRLIGIVYIIMGGILLLIRITNRKKTEKPKNKQ